MVGAIDAPTAQATKFVPSAFELGGEVLALAISGNHLYAAGQFLVVASRFTSSLASFDATTGVSENWSLSPPFAQGPAPVVRCLAVVGDTVYVGGSFTNLNGPRPYLTALATVGGQALAWNPNANQAVETLAVNGSNLLVAGDFTSIGGARRPNLAALSAATGAAADWNPAPNGAVRALASDGSSIYVGGDFLLIAGAANKHITRLKPAPSTTNLYTALGFTADATVNCLAVADGTVFAGGTFTNIGGAPRHLVAALIAESGLANGWKANAAGDGSLTTAIDALAVGGQTLYVGGEFATIGGQPRNFLAAVDTTTARATDWNPFPDGPVKSLLISGGTAYVGGSFVQIGLRSRPGLAAIGLSSGKPTSWDPAVTGPASVANALAQVGDTIYVGGVFTGAGGAARTNLVALDSTTALATDWAPQPSDNVSALYASPTSLYVGGSFSSIGGTTQHYLAAFPISANPGQQLTIVASSVRWTAPGQLSFQMTGASGQRAGIQASSDLTNWTTVGTNVLTGGAGGFLDSQAANLSHRFYRAVTLP